MNTALFARAGGVISVPGAADLTGKKGFFVEIASGEISLCNAVTDLPLGVLGEGDAVAGSVILPNAPGSVFVKLSASPGTVAAGTYLTLVAGGTAAADAGTGARVQVARALEAGAANELIEAMLLEPKALS
jgi:hypothetical protein